MTEHYRTRIAAERQRQIDVEGYTFEHDIHQVHKLFDAARCYVRAADYLDQHDVDVELSCPMDWPWHQASWEPDTPERMREKAGALALAAIDAMAGGQDIVTEHAQLEPMTAETVVRDANGWVYEKLPNQAWMTMSDEMPARQQDIALPAAVLYRETAS